MKTILVPLFSGVEAKNILRTDIGARLLADPEVRAVFLLKNRYLLEYYQAEFAGTKAHFELAPKQSPSHVDRFFAVLKFYLLRSATVDLHRKTRYGEEKKLHSFIASYLVNRIFARPFFRMLVRFADERLVVNRVFDPLFQKYKPDLVFLADLFDDAEVAILRTARAHGVRSLGLINTWDRTTSRWMLRLLPDEFVVFNEIMKEELVRYADMKVSRITISGTVQHDHLLTRLKSPRTVFTAKLGIPSDYEILLYCPIGTNFDKSRPELDRGVIERLSRWVEEGLFGTRKITVLVRFHPNDLVDTHEWPMLPHVVYDRPGKKFTQVLSDAVFSRTRGQNWDMTDDDLQHLADTLYHTRLVICYYTSLSLDAAVLEKPVININFDIREGVVIKRPHPYYETTHYKKARDTGGIAVVQTEQEFKEKLLRYYADPSLGAEERNALVRSQCTYADGKSGERVALKILSAVGL
ncbi:MAG: hypothetical protein V4674_01660 [Patescibacteria group bacterium]